MRGEARPVAVCARPLDWRAMSPHASPPPSDRASFLERFVQEDRVVLQGARLVDHPEGGVLEASLPADVRPERVTYLVARAQELWSEVQGGGSALVAIRFLTAAGDGTDELVRATDDGLVWNADGLVHSVLSMWGDPDAQPHYDSFEHALERLARFEDLVEVAPDAACEAVRRVLRGDDTMHRADIAAFLVRFSRHRAAFADDLRAALSWRLEAPGLEARARAHYQECLDKLDDPDAATAG